MEYILAVIVSLIVEGVKKYMATDSFGTHLFLLMFSIGGAGLYVYFSQTDLWPTALTVLTTAAAFHNLVIRKFGN